MRIKIINGNWWYIGKEGEILDNYYLKGEWYIEKSEEHSVHKKDAEVVEEMESADQSKVITGSKQRRKLELAEKEAEREAEQARKTGTTEEAKHYQVAEKQPIEIMQDYMTNEQFIGFLKGNVIKYLLRIGHKDNDLEDSGKALQYAKWLCVAMNGGKIVPGGK